MNRHTLLRAAFCEIPSTIADIPLRRCSAASFALLGDLQNPMIVGASQPGEKMDIQTLFRAVIEYVWVHSADIDAVCAVITRDDLPAAEIRKLGFQIEIGDALLFSTSFGQAAVRMAASLSEIEEDDTPGKPTAPESSPTGSPPSSSPSEPQETPPASATSSGTPPSSAPSPTSTPPTSPQEQNADGYPPLQILPILTTPSD